MGKARTQAARELAVATPKGDNYFLLRTLAGAERVSGLFEYNLELVGGEDNVPYKELVGKPMTVRLELESGATRYFNGVVSRFKQVQGDQGRIEFRATLVPWLWLLTRRSDCRIFQNKTIPDIIKQVFRDQGLTDFEDKLDGTYREWEYCVQYRETDFAFVSRLMEQEGIYYYFRHENGKHLLVLADSTTSLAPFAGYETVPLKPYNAVLVDYEAVHTWEVERELQPGKFAHTDYDFKAPKRNMFTAAKATRDGAENPLEIFDYPGEYGTTTDGEDMASVRLDEYLTRFEVARATGDARGIAAGCKFKLQEAVREDQNKEHLVTSTTIRASAGEFESGNKEANILFTVEFTAIDAKQLYRAPRGTPRPVIHGCQTAIVVGKSGEEIWTDEHGRVKVQFHWDRESAADENSSCWVRVSQPWAGKSWGAVNIPRIGQEVIVEFLEGDPDRPIITGRVYNGENKPPYDLPAKATMSTMKTNSSKGGGGFNEIRFEDKKDEEQIFIHAQKNMDIRVEGCRYETIVKDRHKVVENDQFEHVKHDRHEQVDNDHYETITNDSHIKIENNASTEITGTLSLRVTGDAAEKYEANKSDDIKEQLSVKAKKIVLEATENLTVKVGKNSIAIDSSSITINAESGKVEIKAAQDIVQEAQANWKAKANANAELKGTAGAKVVGDASAEISGAMVKVAGSGMTEIQGGLVKIN